MLNSRIIFMIGIFCSIHQTHVMENKNLQYNWQPSNQKEQKIFTNMMVFTDVITKNYKEILKRLRKLHNYKKELDSCVIATDKELTTNAKNTIDWNGKSISLIPAPLKIDLTNNTDTHSPEYYEIASEKETIHFTEQLKKDSHVLANSITKDKLPNFSDAQAKLFVPLYITNGKINNHLDIKQGLILSQLPPDIFQYYLLNKKNAAKNEPIIAPSGMAMDENYQHYYSLIHTYFLFTKTFHNLLIFNTEHEHILLNYVTQHLKTLNFLTTTKENPAKCSTKTYEGNNKAINLEHTYQDIEMLEFLLEKVCNCYGQTSINSFFKELLHKESVCYYYIESSGLKLTEKDTTYVNNLLEQTPLLLIDKKYMQLFNATLHMFFTQSLPSTSDLLALIQDAEQQAPTFDNDLEKIMIEYYNIIHAPGNSKPTSAKKNPFLKNSLFWGPLSGYEEYIKLPKTIFESIVPADKQATMQEKYNKKTDDEITQAERDAAIAFLLETSSSTKKGKRTNAPQKKQPQTTNANKQHEKKESADRTAKQIAPVNHAPKTVKEKNIIIKDNAKLYDNIPLDSKDGWQPVRTKKEMVKAFTINTAYYQRLASGDVNDGYHGIPAELIHKIIHDGYTMPSPQDRSATIHFTVAAKKMPAERFYNYVILLVMTNANKSIYHIGQHKPHNALKLIENIYMDDLDLLKKELHSQFPKEEIDLVNALPTSTHYKSKHITPDILKISTTDFNTVFPCEGPLPYTKESTYFKLPNDEQLIVMPKLFARNNN